MPIVLRVTIIWRPVLRLALGVVLLQIIITGRNNRLKLRLRNVINELSTCEKFQHQTNTLITQVLYTPDDEKAQSYT